MYLALIPFLALTPKNLGISQVLRLIKVSCYVNEVAFGGT